MSRLLTIYSQVAFAEYYLPPLINDDYEVKVDSTMFDLPEPVVMKLEAIDSQWYMTNDGNLQLNGINVMHKRYELRPDSIFSYNKENGVSMFIIIVSEREDAVHAFEKIDMSRGGGITIGSQSNNMIQFQFHKLISSHHAEIVWQNSVCYLIDKSKNGVFVNNRRSMESTALHFGDIINIYGLTLVFLHYCMAIDTAAKDVVIQSGSLMRFMPPEAPEVKKVTEKRSAYFKRSPRTLGKYYEDMFEIEGPPAPQKPKRQPLLLTIGPSFTMVLPMILGTTIAMSGGIGTTIAENGGSGMGRATGIIVSGTAGVLAAIWAIARVKQSKKDENEDEKKRVEGYEIYIQKNEDELKYQTGYNAKLITDRYPDALKCTSFTENTLLLWNRNLSHSDMLYVRLGIGTVDFQAPIQIPKARFSLVNDALAEYPQKLKRKYEKIQGVPVGMDFMHMSIVGLLCTGSRAHGLDVVRSIVTQIAANNCYTDVKMVFLYDEAEQAQWEFARWLPHTWSQNGKTRFIASNKAEAADVLYELSCIFREREPSEDDTSTREKVYLPHYVVVLADPSMIENEAIGKYLITTNDIGITTLYISEAYDELPNECTNIIECSQTFNGIYDVSMMQEDRTSIVYDRIDAVKLDAFARKLSNFKVSEIGSGGEIPNSITFMDMYGVKSLQELNVLERWRKSKTYDTLRAMIGVKGGGTPVYLDIHEKYHGPHGMVAGTTGSGKSETMQTYMLSIALNYSPLDVGFFVIDYKGGGMANLFSDLPHMMGTITNLSGNQVHRSMISIKSEIKRRQKVFAEYDVNSIDKYTRLYKNKEASLPVPHLLIIIDEFAELKREQPEFMSELISVAQVGRSLGIHLILATQKPGNVVDDNIRSNSKFRLCLRVQDKTDSNDMIKKPDAAYITQTGRGYLQVGNDEIFELFQSGWSGAPYDANAGECKAESAYLITRNGHSEVGKRQKMKLKEQRRYEWVAYLLDVMHSYGVNADVSDVVKGIYDNLEKSGIEYPQSASNDNKFKKLIEIDRHIITQYGGNVYAGRDEAGMAIEMAASAHVALPDEKEKTQLAATVEYITHIARENGIHNDIRLWLPVLSEMIPLNTICNDKLFDGSKWNQPKGNISAIIGFADDPENQSQFPVGIDFTESGHLAICGGVLSGKSTFLQTLLYSLCKKYDPDMVNIYVLDFSNKMMLPFEKAPQVGAVLTEDDSDKIAKLYVMLKKELERRKKLLRGGSYVQYIRSHKLPAIILAIDGYASMREKTEDAYEEQMMELSREGASYGIYLALTAGGFNMNDIKARVADNIKNVVGMSMGDKFKYADIFHTTKLDVLPEEGVKGRGLILNDGKYLEFQTAVAECAEDDYTRGQIIEKELKNMAGAWTGSKARYIPVIPDKPIWTEMCENAEFIEMMETQGVLPVGYRKKDAGIFSIPLSRIFNYFVLGKAKSGKTNMLRIVTKSAIEKGAQVIYIDPSKISNVLFEKDESIEYYSSPEDYMALGNSIIKIIVERNAYKTELSGIGCSAEEIQERMEERYKPAFIIIDNLPVFVKQIYDKRATKGDVSGFFENLADKGELHNIYIIAGMQPDDLGVIKGNRFADLLLSRRAGVLLGGMAGDQRVLAFDDLSFKERSMSMRTHNGLATLPDGDETTYVVIPTLK